MSTADRWTIFHGGQVRFSNALPLTSDLVPAYGMPQLLMACKHGPDGIVKTDDREWIDRANVTVGRPEDEREPGGEKVQREALKRHWFLTAGGQVVKPDLGSRLRTATRGQRAAEGQLFGYQHVEPTRYAATIEAEAVRADLWQSLMDTFDKKTLRLGRGSGTFYGGAYACRIHQDRGEDLWPACGNPRDGERVRVWALSDLALVDAFGAPCFVPAPELLGLPAGGTFCGSDSAISLRRYSPWNGHLRSRDVERQVIAAGSVLTFVYQRDVMQDVASGAAQTSGNSAVGLWREAGLGRIWIAPPMLDVERGSPPDIKGNRPSIIAADPVVRGDRQSAPDTGVLADPLIAWLRLMVERRAAEAAS
jgi:hypothetical protein